MVGNFFGPPGYQGFPKTEGLTYPMSQVTICEGGTKSMEDGFRPDDWLWTPEFPGFPREQIRPYYAQVWAINAAIANRPMKRESRVQKDLWKLKRGAFVCFVAAVQTCVLARARADPESRQWWSSAVYQSE